MLQKNYTVTTSNGLFERCFISGVTIVQRILKEMVLFPGLITKTVVIHENDQGKIFYKHCK